MPEAQVNPITLLAQNEEIFKRMSEDFDRLGEAVESVNENQMELAASVLEAVSKYEELQGKLNINSQAITTSQREIQLLKDMRDDFFSQLYYLQEQRKVTAREFGEIQNRFIELNVGFAELSKKNREQQALAQAERTEMQNKLAASQAKLADMDAFMDNLAKQVKAQEALLDTYKTWIWVAGGIGFTAVVLQFIGAAFL